ncbi:MAG: M23 family metallopeptidase [Pseudomonadales bacterium]|nr:M23 family metallopeptidase [Pseudomonadales bacterium]
MKLIVLDANFSGSKEFNLSNRKIAYLAMLLAALLLSLLLFIGLYLDRFFQVRHYQAEVDRMREQTLFDQHQINSLNAYSEAVFLEQSRQFGLLQARMTRLEALGGQVADMAGMSEEFDFYREPAIGGLLNTAEPDAIQSEHHLLANMQAMQARLKIRETELLAIDGLVQNSNIQKESYLSGRPIVKGWLSSNYGKRIDPFTGRLSLHKGVDFAGQEDSDVIAVASGVVTWSGDRYGYGMMVEVNHGNGYSTRYAHNKSHLVKVGDVVNKGQALAKMGSTGRSTGPHVHYEVLKNGRQVDPHRYIYRKSI